MPSSDITFDGRRETVSLPDRPAAARYLLDDALKGFTDFGYRGRSDENPTRALEALCGIGFALLALNETLAAPVPTRRRFRLFRR